MKGYKEISAVEFEAQMSGGWRAATKGPISPVFDRTDAAICIVSSDEYAPFASVTVASIVANADANRNYDIVILSSDMTIRRQNRILCLARKNISIRVVDITSYIQGLNFYTWAHFTPNTYYRLLAPDIFIKYEKVIYLDSDVVVNHDIAELYSTPIEGFLMAAAVDTHCCSYFTRQPPLEKRWCKYACETLALEDLTKYFQCGVALYNVQAIHKEFGAGYLIRQASKVELKWLDQDLVNKLFKGRIKELSNRWNVMVANFPSDLDEYHLPHDLARRYFEARMNPYAVHYIGKSIPAFHVESDMEEYFWKYARETPFYERLLAIRSEEIAKDIVAKRTPVAAAQVVQECRAQERLEIARLNSSSAYRIGMFLTWPARKIYHLFVPEKV